MLFEPIGVCEVSLFLGNLVAAIRANRQIEQGAHTAIEAHDKFRFAIIANWTTDIAIRHGYSTFFPMPYKNEIEKSSGSPVTNQRNAAPMSTTDTLITCMTVKRCSPAVM